MANSPYKLIAMVSGGLPAGPSERDCRWAAWLGNVLNHGGEHWRAIMRKAITTEEMVLLKEASEMFNETGCVPGPDGEQVPAEKMVPDVKEYISETIYEQGG
jgi:hypothetical protein